MKRVYECDTCRQQIELESSKRDINLLNNCIITQGCKGSLHSTLSTKKAIKEVDYQSRNILHEHDQELASDTWTVNHNLTTNPITYVYQDQLDETGKRKQVLLDSNSYELYHIDTSTSVVVFSSPCSGVVHSMARSSTPRTVETPAQTKTYVQATANSILTIAIPIVAASDEFKCTLNFISPSTNDTKSVPVVFRPHRNGDDIALFNSPWNGADEIYLGGYGHKVFSARVDHIIKANNIEEGSPFFFNEKGFAILLSNTPYTDSVDMEIDSYIDPSSISSDTLNISAKVTGADLSIEKQHTLCYHPSIKVIKNTF